MKLVLRCSCICFVLLFMSGVALAEVTESGAPGVPAVGNQTPRTVTVPSMPQDVDQFGRIPEFIKGSGSAGGVRDFEAPERAAVYRPVWSQLDGLSAYDKGNAIIAFEVPSDLSSTLRGEVKNAENLWNSGNHDQAITKLRELESQGVRNIGFAVNWKVPRQVEMPPQAAWGSDVRVSQKTLIEVAEHDFDAGTGNLFCVTKWDVTWSVNLSTDGGATWVETFSFGQAFPIVDVSGACMGGYFWVGYAAGQFTYEYRMRRFFASTGLVDNVYFFQLVFNKTVAISDVVVWTNADNFNNVVYAAAIVADGRVIYYWSGDGLTWNEKTTPATTATAHLEAAWNANDATGYFSFATYLDAAGNVHILRNGAIWEDFFFGATGASSLTYPTAVACYQDNVMVYFYGDVGGVNVTKYLRTADAGANWFFGQAAPASFEYAATGRMGGGMALVWQEEVGEPDPVWYQRANYGFPNWSTPTQINEVDVVTGTEVDVNWLPPFVGPHSYGALWINDLTNRWCYFDRLDAGCLLLAPFNLVGGGGRCDLIRITWEYGGARCHSGFKVYRDGILVYTGFDPDQRRWDDTAVPPGLYDYYVRAWDPSGNGPISNVDDGSRLAPPLSPGPIQASDSRCTDVIIGWQNVAIESGYRVYRNGVLIATLPANVVTYTDFTAAPGVTYSYCVEAYNVCGPSPRPCDPGTRGAPPQAPAPVVATDAGPCVNGIDISWLNVPNENGYRVYRNGALLDTKGPNVTMHTDFPPGPGPWDYCVEAYNTCGASARPCDSGACGIVPPTCEVSRTNIDYGPVLVGDCRDEAFDICNPPTATTNLVGAVSETCDHYSIVAGGGPYNLAPGQCRTVIVRFCPTDEGVKTCSVETGNPICADVDCRGEGVPVNCVGPRVKMTDSQGWNGQTVTIYVELQQSPWDISAFALDVQYDTGMLDYIDFVRGDLTMGFNTFNANENVAGVITIGGFQPASDPPIPMGITGNIICLNFQVIGCTFGGQTSTQTPTNLQDDFVGIATCEGTFECVECVSDGDVNGNGSLSPGDAKCAFDIFLFGQTLPPDCDVPNWDCEIIAADANCNLSVSPGDALCIFNRFLFGQPPVPCGCPFPTASGPAASSASAKDPFDVPRDGIITVGDVIRVPVVMEATRGGAAFGFEVNFDSEKLRYEGITVSSAAQEWKALDANEVIPGRVIAGGFDPEGIKAKDVSLGGTLQIAELRFRKLSPDGTIGSIEWVEQRLDREAFEEQADTPDRVTKLDLGKPFPNPFRDAVSAYVMVPTGESRTVKVSVYDVKGRLVKTLLNQTVNGVETVSWDRRTTAGEPVSSGIYFMRMEVSETGFALTRKLVVLK